MHWTLSPATLGLGLLLVTLAPTDARAQNPRDVEHARMNALAGGPTNARDAYILRRYGCFSGTLSAFCHGLQYYRAYPRRMYRR